MWLVYSAPKNTYSNSLYKDVIGITKDKDKAFVWMLCSCPMQEAFLSTSKKLILNLNIIALWENWHKEQIFFSSTVLQAKEEIKSKA